MSSWITATASDYRDLLNQLTDIVTGQSLSSIDSVQSGGSGYAVGDILQLSGGTSTVAATIEVTAISGSAVTAAIIKNYGGYSSPPGDPVSTTALTGAGTGATFNLTFATNGWSILRDAPQEAVSATIGAGGSGYVVGDDIESDVSDGNVTTKATWNVDSVSSGAVTAVSLLTAGEYVNTPTNPVSTTALTGSGTGATLNVTYQRKTGVEKEVILEGTGAGSDDITIGFRTFNVSSAFNWELSGMTGFDSAQTLANQPGVSPGRWDLSQRGAYFPLNNASMTYWINVNSNRIIMIVKVGSTYVNFYLGFINRLATTSDYAYPLAVFGCSSIHTRLFSDNTIGFSGMCDPIANAASEAGPAFLRSPGGTWLTVQNGFDSGTGRTASNDVVVIPCGQIRVDLLPTEDRQTQGDFLWQEIIPNVGDPGTPAARLLQTPESPNPISHPVPCTIVRNDTADDIYGELDSVFWVSAVNNSSLKVSEDRILNGSEIYRVFQNCLRSDVFAFFCVREDS